MLQTKRERILLKEKTYLKILRKI